MLLVSIPLSIPIPHLQKLNPNYFHIYSISISTYFLIGIFNLKSGFLQLLFDSLITYYICQNLIIPLSRENDQDGSKKKKAKKIVWCVFAGLLTHLTFNHAKRIIWKIPYETVEVSFEFLNQLVSLGMKS